MSGTDATNIVGILADIAERSQKHRDSLPQQDRKSVV